MEVRGLELKPGAIEDGGQGICISANSKDLR